MAEKYTRGYSIKACRGKETVVIFELKGWKDNFEILSKAPFVVNVGFDGKGDKTDLLARLQFHFKDFNDPTQVQELDNVRQSYCQYSHIYLDLAVKEIFNKNNATLLYDVKVELVDDKSKVTGTKNAKNSIEKKNIGFQPNAKNADLTNKFIKLKKKNVSYPADPPTILPQPADLRLKISVTPIFLSDTSADEGEASAKTEEDKTLCHAMKNLFAAEENFADLKLETKDNMTLSAHKFMLAARSPVLRELIEKQVKEEGFKGSIKLKDVNAKPMVAILHWMYAGELHEKAGNCMEEIVDAAIAFKLNDLIKILDKKVITICNPENMFQLFGVAKKNGMMTAVKDISQYIKENLETY